MEESQFEMVVSSQVSVVVLQDLHGCTGVTQTPLLQTCLLVQTVPLRSLPFLQVYGIFPSQ